MKMKIGIIGGGSIGLLYAYYLNQSFPVTIYTRTSEQADSINRDGLRMERGSDNQQQTFVKAAVIDDWNGNEELTIITVKQYQLPSIFNKISLIPRMQGALLFLQNGMGHLKTLQNLPVQDIYVGSVEHGAYRAGANLVRHNGEGITRLALFKGNITCLRKFVDQSLTSFPVKQESDYYEMLVQKLVVNAVINPLTAVLKVPNGELIANPHYYHVLESIFSELTVVLDLEEKNEYFQHIIAVCKKTAQNRSSMLKDIEQNQETEIEAILGFVIEEAKTKGLHAPIVTTFYRLVKGMTK